MRRVIPFLLFLLFFGISVISSSSIGPSWDEPDNIYAGGTYLKFFRTFNPAVFTARDQSVFDGRIYAQDENLARYPPVPILVGSFFTSLARR